MAAVGGSGSIGTSCVPAWLARSEKVKGEMSLLKGHIGKLKE
jgi:hypothetical protein